MGVNGEALQLHAAVYLLHVMREYYKSRKNPYEYKSHKNPYQILQVMRTAAEREKVCMIKLLGECRTLWGEHEQAMQCGIELLCS